jgi:hypothetical protein
MSQTHTHTQKNYLYISLKNLYLLLQIYDNDKHIIILIKLIIGKKLNY